MGGISSDPSLRHCAYFFSHNRSLQATASAQLPDTVSDMLYVVAIGAGAVCSSSLALCRRSIFTLFASISRHRATDSCAALSPSVFVAVVHARRCEE
jgi:hypothetical protein